MTIIVAIICLGFNISSKISQPNKDGRDRDQVNKDCCPGGGDFADAPRIKPKGIGHVKSLKIVKKG